MKYYHITKKENRISIQFEGLKSNEDGEIFLFSGWTLTTRRSKKTVLICDLIAQNQLGTDVFIIYEINPKGIKGKIENDNVGELTSENQWIITQDKISRSYVKLLGERSIDSKSMNEFYLDLSPKLAKIRTV
jgi:hypothetical protein